MLLVCQHLYVKTHTFEDYKVMSILIKKMKYLQMSMNQERRLEIMNACYLPQLWIPDLKEEH